MNTAKGTRDQTKPESGTHFSRRGVEITVSRIPQPDCPHGSQQVEIRYGRKVRTGLCEWFPDTPRLWPRIADVLSNFINDCDAYGRAIGMKPEKGPLGAVTGGPGPQRLPGGPRTGVVSWRSEPSVTGLKPTTGRVEET